MLESTGERFLPWFEDAVINYEHLHRYAFAAQYVKGKNVLDLASGEGYGSHMLSREAESVLGVDIDEAAVRHASQRYRKSNLRFSVGSITDVPVEGESVFDIIICYEAIEHIRNYEECLGEVKRLLVPGGLFIVSTPEKAIYSDEAQFKNEYHVHEFYFDEFRFLLEKYFKNTRFLGQRVYSGSNIWPLTLQEESRHVEYLTGRVSGEYVFLDQDKKVPRYYIAISSDDELQIELKSSALLDMASEFNVPMETFRKELAAKDGEIAALRDKLHRAQESWNRGFWAGWKRIRSFLF